MNFSVEWDGVYRANEQLSRWPWSDLVSYIHRYARPSDGFQRVLELGCGAGANIPLFEKLGTDYHGIEGSPSIVQSLHERFPKIRNRIVVGDFTKTIPFDGKFDLVVDRGSITHNVTSAIHRTLGMIFSRLRTGGKFVGIDWFSTEHCDAQLGDALDAWTRTNIRSGQFSGIGAVHFTDREHLCELLCGSGFEIERLQHKLVDTVVPEGNNRFAAWNFVAVKP
jgi:SAM-dependent methyltransferase